MSDAAEAIGERTGTLHLVNRHLLQRHKAKCRVAHVRAACGADFWTSKTGFAGPRYWVLGLLNGPNGCGDCRAILEAIGERFPMPEEA